MRPRRCGAAFALLVALTAGVNGCSKPDATVKLPVHPPPDPGDQPPVALNAESPVEYPPQFYDQGIEGKVILRLFADSTGRVVNDSTRVQESSGYPALDSAAVRAAPRLVFAPALHNGNAVAASFLQPVHFRHPQNEGTSP